MNVSPFEAKTKERGVKIEKGNVACKTKDDVKKNKIKVLTIVVKFD